MWIFHWAKQLLPSKKLLCDGVIQRIQASQNHFFQLAAGKGDLWAIQLKREKRFTCYLAKGLNSLYFDCTGLNVESARIFGRPTESCNGPSRWANDNRK